MHRLASLALLVVVGIGLVMGAGAAPATRRWALETPPPSRPGARSRPTLHRDTNSSTETIENKHDVNEMNTSVSEIMKTNITIGELNIVKPGDEPIKTWEDLKSKLLNEDFLGAEAREEVIRILHGKRNDTDEQKQDRKDDQKSKEEKKPELRAVVVLSPATRSIIMASIYGVVAILAVLIAFYAIVPKKKTPHSQTKRPSRTSGDLSADKEDPKMVKSPVTDVSRVSIAADIISARSEAAEKAQQAAARAAEQTSSSQPLTPVGARVADKMEVAEAVANERKSRLLRHDVSGSKVFGGMPSRCKGIRPELGRSGIVLEGFHERDVPERRHSILGILRGDEEVEVLPEISKSLPDMQKLRTTVDDNMARAATTTDMSRTILDSSKDKDATENEFGGDAAKTPSRALPAVSSSRGSHNLPRSAETMKRGSLSSWTSSDAETPHSDEATDADSPLSDNQHKRKHILKKPEQQDSKTPLRKPGDIMSKSPRASISDSLERGQRPSKSQARQYLPRSRRTLETVHSESILSPESEIDTPVSEQPSSGSASEIQRPYGAGMRSPRSPRSPRSSASHVRSSSTIRPSLSSFDAAEGTPSTTSNDDRGRTRIDDKKITGAMHAVEKLVDKLTAPMVDSIRAAALTKRRASKGSTSSDDSPEKPPSELKNTTNRRILKSRTPKHTDESQKHIPSTTTDKTSESSEHKPILPRIWNSSTELPAEENVSLKSSDPSLRATDVSSFETSAIPKEAPDSDAPESPSTRPILPRMWTSDTSDAEEKTTDSAERGKEKSTGQPSPPTKETKDIDSTRKARKKNIFSPQAWGIKCQKPKSDGKSIDNTNESLNQQSKEPTTGEKHGEASVLAESKTVSAATSRETMSIKSISEHMSWDSTGPASSTQGTVERSSPSFRSVRSRTSARLSRYKYTSDPSLKRHGILKRPDGTPILPVSQATLQTIFSKSNAEETILESPRTEQEQNTNEEVMNKSDHRPLHKVSSLEKPRNYSLPNQGSTTDTEKQMSVEAIENLISYNVSTTNSTSPLSPEPPVRSRGLKKRLSSVKMNKSKRERKGSKHRPLIGGNQLRSSDDNSSCDSPIKKESGRHSHKRGKTW